MWQIFSRFCLGLLLAQSSQAVTCSVLRNNWVNYYKAAFKVYWISSWDCEEDGKVAEAMYHLQSDTFTPNRSGGLPNFYQYVTYNLKKLNWDSDCNSLGYTTSGSGTITLCPPFLSQTVENRTATLVHEARHLMADDPKHVTCSKGAYKGNERACDQHFYAGNGGSGYNADIWYFSWLILKGSNLNGLRADVIKSEIRALIPDRFNEIKDSEISYWRSL